ncbi:hypothetical protein [Helicobacter rodentium]|nr:hypothetical protein [Helicobacter rodentium]
MWQSIISSTLDSAMESLKVNLHYGLLRLTPRNDAVRRNMESFKCA